MLSDLTRRQLGSLAGAAALGVQRPEPGAGRNTQPRGSRPTPSLPDRLLQTLDTLALLAHRPQKLFQHNTLLAMLKLLQHEPIHVGPPPRLLAR
jgi:hypothetical protein